MPIIDASVAVDALVVVGPPGEAARAELRGLAELQVPASFTAEVTSALRSLVRQGNLSPIRAAAALNQLQTIRTIRYPFERFIIRAWELRENITVYDAWYVALAEWLSTELVTADERLARAVGPSCPVRLPGKPRPES